MQSDFENELIKLRYLVGYLGEKSQANWWPTEFLSSSSRAFLEPVFVRTWRLAQFNGVSEAARRVHDERIGVGRVFHLFRLPEVIELRLLERFHDAHEELELDSLLSSAGIAIDELHGMANASVESSEGPVEIGAADELSRPAWTAKAAAAYHVAFTRHIETYPYFAERP